MVLSQLFLAYSDLGLFLAVIGVYVFFAALWLIYAFTERSEKRVKREIEDSVAELSMSQRHASNHRVGFDEDMAAYGQEISDLRTELTAVREIAMQSGQQLQAMRDEIDAIRSEFVAHLDELHADQPDQSTEDVAIEMSRVIVQSPPAAASVRSELRLYDPVAEPEPAEEVVPAQDIAPAQEIVATRQSEQVQQVSSEDTSMDPELGLIYTSKPIEPDNLTRIWGVGAVNQDLLNENGIFFFEQVAKWNEEQIGKFNDILCFRGRIEREDWVGQAKRLSHMKKHERRAA